MTQGADPRWLRPAAQRQGDAKPLADAARCPLGSRLADRHQRHAGHDRVQFQEGGFHKTTVGRVQTPTLAILVEREERIRAFSPRDYWEVEGEFGAVAGPYRGRWFDEKFRKPMTSTPAPERLWDIEARPRRSARNAWASTARSRKRASRPPSSRRCSTT
jgi:DNA topoisomerase-3